MLTASERVTRSEAPSAVERWYVLIVMCLVYAINIAARYVVTTVFEPIRLELHLTDAGAAFLTGVPLALFYVVFGIPIAWLADRSNRRNIVAACAHHLVRIHGVLRPVANLLAVPGGRIGVGVGEAGGTPPSTSIVSDYFPPERRTMALSVLALGAPIGAWMGADLAGAVAQAFGWRAAFFALGAPGLLLGMLVFLTVREPKRGRLDAIGGEGKPSLSQSLQFLWRQRAAFHVIMASGVCCLWGWGLVWWTPTFLMRTYDLNVAQAGAVTGHAHLVGGILATAGTAWLMARPYMVSPRRVLWTLAADHRIRDHSVVLGLLDAHVVGGEADVLDLHSRHLFLHRTLHGTGAEPRAEQHALHLHCLVGPRRQRIQSDRRAAGGRDHERLLRRRPRGRCRIVAPRVAGARTDGILGGLAFRIGRREPLSRTRRAPSATQSREARSIAPVNVREISREDPFT